MEIDLINERIKVFSESKTYSFIKLKCGTLFNGYILSIQEGTIMFDDDTLGSIPIIKSEIEVLSYSNRKAKQ